MRATAIAHANIALIKYWGKRHEADETLNLPAVGSISMTLGGLSTRTTVSFSTAPGPDRVTLCEGGQVLANQAPSTRRVSALVDIVRRRAGIDGAAEVHSDNDFPTGAGLASSASGFAALALAATRAAGLSLSPTELSALARQGSGSAARSIFGGFVEMERGAAPDGGDAVARQLASLEHWPLEVVVLVTTRGPKSVGSTDGMERTRETSPFYGGWLAGQASDLADMRQIIAERDFERFAELTEHSCLKMHAVMMSARPALLYWHGATLDLLRRVGELRRAGVGVCFTVDAGPQVKAICAPGDAERVARELGNVPGVVRVIRSPLGGGARLDASASKDLPR